MNQLAFAMEVYFNTRMYEVETEFLNITIK
jgi:hypothetical protein